MRNICIFDTNFMVSKKNNLRVDEVTKKGFECFIPEVVVREIKGQNARQIRNEYTALKAKLESEKIKLYCTISDTTDISASFALSDSKIDKYIKSLFKENIIQDDNPKATFHSLMERTRLKTPPFNDSDNSSDKGFMDTLIWISILSFASKNEAVNILFFTDDKAFLSNAEQLNIEFVGRFPKSTIEIIKDQDFEKRIFGKVEQEVVHEQNESPIIQLETQKRPPLDEARIEKIRTIVNSIMYSEDYDFNNGTYLDNNFNLSEEIDESKTEAFCETILASLGDFIFEELVDIEEIFTQVSINHYKSSHKVALPDLRAFASMYSEIKTQNPESLRSLLKFIMRKLNSMVKNGVPVTEDDLPF